MAERQLTLPGAVVKKSNTLARARWPAGSVYEPRLVALIASRVHRDDEDFHTYEIPAKEILGEDYGGRAQELLKKVVDNLIGRVISIDEEEEGWTKYSLFSKCRYRAGDGVLEVRFDPDLKPHFLGLQRYFTQYELMEFMYLPSRYSQRLFEFLKSWGDKPEISIALVDLHELLNTTAEPRRTFTQMKRKILAPAHTHIHKYTSLSFSWEPIKQGRKIVAIRFIFSKPRKTEAEARAKVKQDQRESKAKNALFLAAARCLGEKGGTCGKPDGKKECAVCPAA